MSQSVNDLYMALFKRFRDGNDPQPSLSARELTAHICEADKRQTASWAYRFIDDQLAVQANALCTQCLCGRPLAHILGEWDFYGHTFQVTPDVLIPRADTERLCELAIERASQVVNPRVLDVCCGTGCIGIALLKEIKDARVTAIDISDAAIKISNYNAGALEVSSRYQALQADALQAPPKQLRHFDIIVSNPPYITRAEMLHLDASVRDYEPTQALYGGKDGLDFYYTIAKVWGKLLIPGGLLLLECGHTQAFEVAEILDENEYAGVAITDDYAGIPRIVHGYQIGDGSV